MTKALAIFAHALRMLTHEPTTTFRVIAPALLVVLASVIAAVILVPDTLAGLQAPPEAAPNEVNLPDGSSALTLLLLTIAAVVGYALMAILWHRHVLLNGTGVDSTLAAGTSVIGGYLWRAFIVGAVQFLIAIPIAIVVAILGGVGAALTGGVALLFVLGVLAGVIFVWLALRLSVVLPAAALGNSMRVGESWEATAQISRALWGLAALLALINASVSLISAAIVPDGLALSMAVQTVIFILEGLVFISVLTTLYGHLVEGRPLG